MTILCSFDEIRRMEQQVPRFGIKGVESSCQPQSLILYMKDGNYRSTVQGKSRIMVGSAGGLVNRCRGNELG